jgi:methylated-DNA-protein-cysteine methyltransferase-like protein
VTNADPLYKRIYATVKKIPRGRVASYGQVARVAGLERHARMVGYALHALNEEDVERVPWQRVINAQGYISIRSNPLAAKIQRKLLEQEGVEFDHKDKVDFKKFGWKK